MATVLERLNFALHQAIENDVRVYVLGEDILDPYGGAFKVTRGLSTQFPDRVLTTPISEAAITGVATGMALRGLRPVVEIMFGDFITLCADQLINHAAKFRWIYNDQVRVPLVVRTPMGGGRGYGPTHSQSIEKIFLGIPGLKVLAPNTLIDPASLLASAITDDDPVLFVEHKLLYACPVLDPGRGDLIDFNIEQRGSEFPISTLRPTNRATLTFACYGYNFELVRKAALELIYEHEIFTDIVLYTQLSPFDVKELLESVDRTGKLITVEEGGKSLGWGAEIITRVTESGIQDLSCLRVAALDLPIATSKPLEDAILPSVKDIVRTALELSVR
jgi:pyruvate/2-oxoglutarate/acetoin dehydrogenase E1 component